MTKICKKKLMKNYFSFLFVYLLESTIDQTNSYMLVMEYADGGTLREYLKDNFKNLTWDDKYNLAYQLTCAMSCLHDEEIVHRDLVNITCFMLNNNYIYHYCNFNYHLYI